MKKLLALLLTTIMIGGLTACGGGSGESAGSSAAVQADSSAKGTAENPFILGVSPMSGWYAWYGVEGTGIFEANGVNVKIEFFPVYSDSLTAFNSGNLDGICIAASDAVAPFGEGIDFKVVLVNDNSYGADGLVVSDGISSIEDLRGKTVATELGTLEHMFLLKILEDNGMTIDDIQFTNMTINDAGPAFIAGSVDAAVLWEPTLSMAIENGGNLLYSTKETPGLIPDTLAVHTDIVEQNPDCVQKIVDSWFDGVEKLNAGDEAFLDAICSGAELSREEYDTMLAGVTIFDKAANQNTFKAAEDYTSLAYTIQASAEFLKDVGMISAVPEGLENMLEDKFIQ